MDMLLNIKRSAEKFKKILSEKKKIRIISHYDCDGITAASILVKTLQRMDMFFSLSFVKQMEKSVIDEISKENYDVFCILDLSCELSLLNKLKGNVFVIDHHETIGKMENLPQNIEIINPFFNDSEREEDEISAAGLTYLFSKALNENNKDLAQLAVLGMIGDILDKSISKINNQILKDSEAIVKKGLPLFSCSRPLHKALEFANIFIPGVTGSENGVYNLLRESGLVFDKKKRLIDLSDQELSKLVTAIILRRINKIDASKAFSCQSEPAESILGNIYILKMFNHTEDARELSTLINACGRLGHPDVALSFCIGSKKAKQEAEDIYFNYKNNIVEALKFAEENKIAKIEYEKFVIMNYKNMIKDTIVGTITSIIASSFIYPDGKILVGLAYREDGKIKVSTRISGKSNGEYNLKELLHKVCANVNLNDAESGGHAKAAGCLIPAIEEEHFIKALTEEINGVLVKEIIE